MKIWAITLSIYVTLLAAMPCCVFDNCPDDKVTTEQTASNHDQGDDDGCGTCSPFFNCSTCNASFVVATCITFDFSPIRLTNSFQSAYASVIIKNTAGKIWQPPKLV